jgi:elongator complex protein 5
MLRPGTRPLTELREEIESLLSRSKTRKCNSERLNVTDIPLGTLFLIDSLNALATIATSQMSTFLSSLITPTVTLVGTYHEDVPVMDALSAYSPHPLTLLRYIATTVFTVHSLAHVLARKAAKDRSSALPLFGLDEDEEGLVIGFGSNDPRGVVLEMEHRRKSGRTIKEWFFVSARSEAPNPRAPGFGKEDRVILLEDHPLYKASLPPEIPGMDQKVDVGSSFDLGLTEKQRKDRDGVVLPYYDAQRDVGSAGGGGRILYDMGEEDDFDEEEDEI